MGMWFLFLVLILLMMMVVGSRFGGANDEEEEIGSGTYHGEEEEETIESDEGQKQKDTTPLWKYVTRLGGRRGGGTTKFTCLHCNKAFVWAYAM